MTSSGTPGLCLATASALASIMPSISARICWMRISSGVCITSMDFAFLGCGILRGNLRLPKGRELLPRVRRFILRTPDRPFAACLMRCDIDLQVIRQGVELLLAVIGPGSRWRDAGDVADGGSHVATQRRVRDAKRHVHFRNVLQRRPQALDPERGAIEDEPSHVGGRRRTEETPFSSHHRAKIGAARNRACASAASTGWLSPSSSQSVGFAQRLMVCHCIFPRKR